MNKLNIVILHSTITNHDAIGNDVMNMYDSLKETNNCYLFANNLFIPNLKSLNLKELYKLIDNKNNLLIYHHSFYWNLGEEILHRAKCKIIIKYHNITPKEFFKDYSKSYYISTSLGEQQTIRLSKMLPNALWLSDSNFNLEAHKNNFTGTYDVLPPFNMIDRWSQTKPNEKILKTLIESDNINLLFVGRMSPNKNQLFLLQVVYEYIRNFDKKIKLFLIGKVDDNLKIYNNEIFSTIKLNKIDQYVEIHQDIAEEDKLAYFLGCDFFVTAAEHEGFCVPLVEGQFTNLPVIAPNSNVFRETLGKEQLTIDLASNKYASAINILYKNKLFRDYLIENGFKNYNNYYTNKVIMERFRKLVTKYLNISI